MRTWGKFFTLRLAEILKNTFGRLELVKISHSASVFEYSNNTYFSESLSLNPEPARIRNVRKYICDCQSPFASS